MSKQIDLSGLDVPSLLRLYANTMDALRATRVIRSSNNPACDFAEWLVARGLNLSLVTKSQKGHDAVDHAGLRYQIKSRRVTKHNPSRQLGVIRNLDDTPFDYVVAVMFDHEFGLHSAFKMPIAAIRKYARYRDHVNGHILILQGAILNEAGVEDVTHRLAETVRAMAETTNCVRLEDGAHFRPEVGIVVAPSGTHMTQRNVMRALVSRLGLNADAVVAAYAEEERCGRVKRSRNAAGWSSEAYARALWADGIHKGWLASQSAPRTSKRQSQG